MRKFLNKNLKAPKSLRVKSYVVGKMMKKIYGGVRRRNDYIGACMCIVLYTFIYKRELLFQHFP